MMKYVFQGLGAIWTAYTFIYFGFKTVRGISTTEIGNFRTLMMMATFAAICFLGSIACSASDYVDLKEAETEPKAEAPPGKEPTETL